MGNKKNSRTHIQIRMNQRTPTTEVLDRADQQQGPQKTMVSTRRGVEVVTVNKQEMEALRKAAKEDAKKKRELEKMAQEQKRFSRSWRRCKVRWRLPRNERKMRPWQSYPQTGRSKRKISMTTLSNIRWQLPNFPISSNKICGRYFPGKRVGRRHHSSSGCGSAYLKGGIHRRLLGNCVQWHQGRMHGCSVKRQEKGSRFVF